ncbi:MAG: NusG domain II-containing protein [Rhodocyclaceae bacterium]
MAARDWHRHILAGDVLVFLAGAGLTVVLAMTFWSSDTPQVAVIRAKGQVVARLSLDRASHFEVSGPLGLTQIEIMPGRARVLSDPGPRQYCVKQGWLARSGAVAVCAPNEVTLSLEGRRPAYDSMAY